VPLDPLKVEGQPICGLIYSLLGLGAEQRARENALVALPHPSPVEADPERRERQLDEYAKGVHKLIEHNLSYPAEARRRGQEGVGEVRFLIRRWGFLERVEVVRSTGFPVLDRHMIWAVESARHPGGREVPVPRFAPVPVESDRGGVEFTGRFQYRLRSESRTGVAVEVVSRRVQE
jgi:TonB family protein